jgi:hypothetical protein
MFRSYYDSILAVIVLIALCAIAAHVRSVRSAYAEGGGASPDTSAAPSSGAVASHSTVQADEPESTTAVDNDLASIVQGAVASETYQCSEVIGGAFGKFPFQSVCPNGLLIGFRVGLGKFMGDKDNIQYIQPIFLTPKGERYGKAHGGECDRVFDIKAPAGCAVSGVAICGGGGLDALTVSFMKIKAAQLDPTEQYVASRIGAVGGADCRLGGDGTPVIGICGRCDADNKWLGLGLVFLSNTPTADHDQAK